MMPLEAEIGALVVLQLQHPILAPRDVYGEILDAFDDYVLVLWEDGCKGVLTWDDDVAASARNLRVVSAPRRSVQGRE